jgi:hypothetical protein
VWGGGARTHAHTREDEKRALFYLGFRFPSSVWVKFDLGWIGLRLGMLLSPRQEDGE